MIITDDILGKIREIYHVCDSTNPSSFQKFARGPGKRKSMKN